MYLVFVSEAQSQPNVRDLIGDNESGVLPYMAWIESASIWIGAIYSTVLNYWSVYLRI